MSDAEDSQGGRARAPLDVRALSRLARRAGQRANDISLSATAKESALEQVGREVESLVAQELRSLDSRVPLSLASQSSALPGNQWVLTLDPLDGEDAFVCGLPTWAVCLGLLRDGQPWSTAVCAPALGDLYVASSGRFRWRGRVLSPTDLEDGARGFVLGSGLKSRSILRLKRRRVLRGPLSYPACLVARGAAEGALLGKLNLRQALMLSALLQPVGAQLISARTGEVLSLDSLRPATKSRDPILAARAGSAASLVARLKR